MKRNFRDQDKEATEESLTDAGLPQRAPRQALLRYSRSPDDSRYALSAISEGLATRS
ncbi:hypothetical protein REMIM1_PB00124 (plasmid) [Rhizobium etli bv. mimosae str. Mim1]|nr:hypothetical protein REMIM1_PB00124 [Rhizobium etli bv. mimosae str. Mim1]